MVEIGLIMLAVVVVRKCCAGTDASGKGRDDAGQGLRHGPLGALRNAKAGEHGRGGQHHAARLLLEGAIGLHASSPCKLAVTTRSDAIGVLPPLRAAETMALKGRVQAVAVASCRLGRRKRSGSRRRYTRIAVRWNNAAFSFAV